VYLGIRDVWRIAKSECERVEIVTAADTELELLSLYEQRETLEILAGRIRTINKRELTDAELKKLLTIEKQLLSVNKKIDKIENG
jgi:hypothetical protein